MLASEPTAYLCHLGLSHTTAKIGLGHQLAAALAQLLKIHGWPKVRRVLAVIDSVDAIGVDLADAAPDYWRHVHNRLTAGLEFALFAHPPSGLAAAAEAAMSRLGRLLISAMIVADVIAVTRTAPPVPRLIWNASPVL